MTWLVSVRATAVSDLRDARAWYEQQRPGLGPEFDLVIAGAMLRLEESPELCPLYYRSFRRLLTERFPYKVFFQIHGETVIVFRVLHASRDHIRSLNPR